MVATYRANIAETGAWLRSSGDLSAAVRVEAERIADVARAIAPVRTGRYKASIHVEAGRGWDGRVAADVIASVPYSAAVEFGNAHTHGRGQHVLRRASGA